MFGSVPQIISIDLANALLFVSFAVTWTGARVFDGRRPLLLAIMAGPLVWLAVCQLPGIGAQQELRFLFASGIIATYTWLTAYEFWRGRERAAGVAMAGDLHAVRARFAVPAAHAACRLAAVAARQASSRASG